MAQDERPMIEVALVYAGAPHQIEHEALQLPVGATVADACTASALVLRLGAGLGAGLGGAAQAPLRLGLWGRLCGPGTVLQAHDRLELLRPLLADPMEARRQRLQRDGLRKVQRPPRSARSA